MIEISSHPIYKNVGLFKKQAHLLRIIAARHFTKLFSPHKFIGVTGSVGKTSTVIAAKAVLSEKYNTISTIENLDTITNLPITLLKNNRKVERVVLELGISYPGEMEFYLSLVNLATGIITQISNQHSEYLGGIEEIAEEKARLIKALPDNGTAILNGDDPIVSKMAELTKAKVIFFGINPEKNNIWADNIKIENFQLKFGLHLGVERVEIVSNFLGTRSVYALLAAAALGVSEGMPLTQIKKGLEKALPPEHRLSTLPGFNDSIILDDTYNAAPIAVEEAIETLSLVPARRRILVLGEMRELGPLTEKFHRQIAQKIFKEKPSLVLLGTGHTKIITDELIKLGFQAERMETNLRNQDLGNRLLKILTKGDVVLIKGAHALRLDEVVKRIMKPKLK